MKFILMCCTALIAALASAAAADLPRKAAISPYSGYPAGSGFYWGVNGGLGTGTASNVASVQQAGGPVVTNAGALVTQYGEVGLTVGYTWAQGGAPLWYGLEGTFDFSNINSGTQSLSGFSLGGPASFTQLAILGAPLGTIQGLIPNLGNLPFPVLPPLPSGVSAGNGNMYLGFGAYEQDVTKNFFPAATGLSATGRDWLVGFEAALGTRWLLSNHTALDGRLEYRNPGRSTCVGAAAGTLTATDCAGLGTAYMARTSILF
jgi:hypothetical protein